MKSSLLCESCENFLMKQNRFPSISTAIYTMVKIPKFLVKNNEKFLNLKKVKVCFNMPQRL